MGEETQLSTVYPLCGKPIYVLKPATALPASSLTLNASFLSRSEFQYTTADQEKNFGLKEDLLHCVSALHPRCAHAQAGYNDAAIPRLQQFGPAVSLRILNPEYETPSHPRPYGLFS